MSDMGSSAPQIKGSELQLIVLSLAAGHDTESPNHILEDGPLGSKAGTVGLRIM